MPKRTRFVLIFLVSIFITSYSCTEKFFPKVNSEDGILVVDGRITNQPATCQVKLFRTVKINSQDSLIMEPAANIILNCDDGYQVQLIETSRGVYANPDPNFIGETNKFYWIEITTSNGKKYESTPEKMQSPLNVQNIYGEVGKVIIDRDEQKDAVKFFFDVQNPESDVNHYFWNYQHSWEWHTLSDIKKTDNPAYICYPEAKSNSVFIHDASNLKDKIVNHLPLSVIDEDQVKLNFEYFLRVHVYSISKECYLFWNNIKKVSSSNGSLFDVIPGNVPGNIQCCSNEEKVLGYFQVSSHATYGSSFTYNDYNITFNQLPVECNLYEISPMIYNPDKHHIVRVESLPEGGTIYHVRNSYCYDCSIKYSSNKPSFWID